MLFLIASFARVENPCHEERPSSFETEHLTPAEVCLKHFRLLNLFWRTRKNVSVEYDEIGNFARLQRPDLIFFEHEPRVINCVHANGLLSREGLLRMNRIVHPPRPSSDRGADSEKWVVRV